MSSTTRNLLVLLLVCPPVSAGILKITIDTSAFTGAPALMAFDLTRGDAASNVLTISDFTTDAVLGSASSVGGPLTGALPGTVTLGDSDFFNELLQEITLDSTVSFTLALTEDFTPPTPSAFSLFLLDAMTGVPLFGTADPTGADALFALDITGSPFGSHQSFHSTLTATPLTPPPDPDPIPVPAPGTLALFAAGLALLAVLRRGLFASLHRIGPRCLDAADS